MPKAYVILTEAIKDQAAMAAYGKAAAPAIAGSGARVLAVDPDPQNLEGDWHGDRTVIMEFPSAEAARAWYDSAAYTSARTLRQAAADTNAVIITGLPAPGGK
ncbi:DUF1330 domain-containing protein [Actinomadura napierensis]|uniref:DUF1330 domain-containing protein n=1 Tax=Actinomadura napierensis TaxID=267854 RepID=A0ABP5JW83_9ACTN